VKDALSSDVKEDWKASRERVAEGVGAGRRRLELEEEKVE